MAVAVKNNPEVTPSTSLFTRVAVASLLGVVAILLALGVVFYLVPDLYWRTGLPRDSFVARFFLGILIIACLGGLLYVGSLLLGRRPLPGVRAGIAVGFLGALTILLLTRWASVWFEHFAYDKGYFPPVVGAGLTAAVLAVLLAVAARFYFQASFERTLVTIEEQGWFSTFSYKPLQGVRVRRGTLLGLLLLVGAGVYTLLYHGLLDPGRNRMPEHWSLSVPFTGSVAVVNPGDLAKETGEGKVIEPRLQGASPDNPVRLSRYELRDINEAAFRTYAEVTDPGSATGLTRYKIYPKAAIDDANKDLGEGDEKAKSAPVATAGGPTTFQQIPLLPYLQYTVPLLMIALALWFAWRAVNMPVFADFLIATEAELNKVSWASRKRLIQDTVVVLVTLIIMTVFLFGMDQVWRTLLSWKPIGVLNLPESSQEQKSPEDRKW